VDIILDGQPLEFTLEEEKTLFDIYSSVGNWLDAQGGEIVSFETAKKSYTALDKDELALTSFGDGEKITIKTRGKRERAFDELKILYEFFTLLHDAMNAGNSEAAREILEEYPFVRGSLAIHLTDLFASEPSPARALDAYRLLLLENKADAAAEAKKEASDFVGLVIRVLLDRMQEMKNPTRESFAVVHLLRSAKSSVENVAVLLQTGRDREAMQTVLSFIEIVLKALRILGYRGKEDGEVEEFCREFNKVLNDLTGAFSLKDSVLIGDLLEYEISPRIDRLAELLETDTGL
jgi:hypothetical protein